MEEKEVIAAPLWQTLAGIGFSLWAIFVPISAKWVVDSLEKMTTAQTNYAAESARRNELLEGRMARFEERQFFLMEQIKRMQIDIDRQRNGS